MFAGLAFTTKYTGGILFLCSLTAVIFQAVRQLRAGNRFPMKAVLLFCAGAGVFPIIWLVRNLVLTGNPVYPFFLPAAEMDAVRLSVYQGAAPYGEWWEGLLLPFRAALWGQESAEGYSVSIGPLLLLLAVGNLLRTRLLKPEETHALRLGMIFFLSGWFSGVLATGLSGYLIQTRMYYSIFPAFAVLAALGWDAVQDIRWQKYVFPVCLARSSCWRWVFRPVTCLSRPSNRMPCGWTAGLISPADYRRCQPGLVCPGSAGRQRPAGWCQASSSFMSRADWPVFQPATRMKFWTIGKSAGWATLRMSRCYTFWKQKGYNYLFVNRAGMEFLADGSDPHHPAEEVRALQDLLKQLPLVKSFGESYQIYTIP